jgi:hypothetical protein
VHLISSRSGNLGQLSHMVTKIPASFCSVPPHYVGLSVARRTMFAP